MKSETKTGIFLGGALLIIAVLIFIVGDLGRLFKKPGYPLYASFETVAGLDPSATVRMSGVKIGYVTRISLEGRLPRVELSIDPAVQVPRGSKATLASLGLLGEKYVEILPSQEQTWVAPRETLEALSSVSFDQLGLLILSIGTEVKEVSQRVQAIMGESNQARLAEVLENLSSATRSFNDLVEANKAELNTTILTASEAFRDFDRMVKNVAGDLESSTKALRGLVEENRDNVKGSVQKMKDVVDKMDTSVNRLNELLEKLSKGQGSLGKVIQDPGLYDQAQATVADVRNAVKPLSALRAGVEAQADYYGASELLKSTLSFSLWTGGGPFLRAQIVHNPWDDRFTYSLQGGRRWGSLAPRFGILESEFGLGLDIYALKDRLRFSLDGYDFNRDPGPRFRLASRVSPWRYFYLLLGLDDLMDDEGREVFFGLGVGLE